MDLYLDLHKAMLNFAKLVKKPVQVKGKNGKVFTRMQWVRPGEASTGMGIRMIKTKQGLQNAIKDGIHHHEDYHQALKDQGVDPDTFEDHHPHFFLPETEDSFNNRMDRVDELENKHGFGATVDNDDHEISYQHEWQPPEHMHPVYDEYHFVPRDIDKKKEEEFLSKHGISPEIHSVMKSVEALDFGTARNSSRKLEEVSRHIASHHWPIIKSQIATKIFDDFDKDDPDAHFIKNVQMGALTRGNMNHNLIMAHHPAVARATINKILGEGTADKWRSQLSKGSLSVNFPGMHIKGIEENGYNASQLDAYINKNIGEHGITDLDKVMQDYDEPEQQFDAIRELGHKKGEPSWYDVAQRAEAEYNAIGLKLEDRKPTYVALNPNGRESGAASYYGNRWMKVDESILKHCTATFDDSFMESRSVAKIWSLDHLKDMFILKQLSNNEDQDLSGSSDPDSWIHSWGDIPIELQYHKPLISADKFEIQEDAGKIAREKNKAKSMDEWDEWAEQHEGDDDLIKDYCGFNEQEMDMVTSGIYSLGEAIEEYKPHMLKSYSAKPSSEWDDYQNLPYGKNSVEMLDSIDDKMNELGMSQDEKQEFLNNHMNNDMKLSDWIKQNKPDAIDYSEDKSLSFSLDELNDFIDKNLDLELSGDLEDELDEEYDPNDDLDDFDLDNLDDLDGNDFDLDDDDNWLDDLDLDDDDIVIDNTKPKLDNKKVEDKDDDLPF